MGQPRSSTAWLLSISVVAALGLAVGASELWRAVSHSYEKLSLSGVSNFGRMTDQLYRGAQPTPEGFAQIKAMGIDTVVRFSLGEEGSVAERGQVEALGMRFVNIPWSSVHEPTSDQVINFLTLAHDHPGRKIFVHCKAGADRTGVMVALYRIALDHWTPAQAIDEMKAFHYRYLFLPHLQAYVEAFPAKLGSDPGLRRLETAVN
jgi:tyrosine-protein phosphatase SIW14